MAVIDHTGDAKLPATLFGQALDSVQRLGAKAAKDNRPVASRLVVRSVDEWISRPDFPSVTELSSMVALIKQAHAIIHDDDPHVPNAVVGA
ncbi:MAG TPA: hypothetical protein VGU71_00060 [Candidatus Dormibacteraeota bacterium]|nr:hypothetical protein [Candidatus Dormibacteraeota bacterium]